MNSRTDNLKVKMAMPQEADVAVISRFFSNRLRLSQVRTLVAIAESGQLKKVADQMNVTPAAVSKQISEMEDALCQEIMRRSGNGVVLTELGLLLARRGREVLDQLNRTRIEVEAMCSGLHGRLGIGAGFSLSPLLFPALVLSLKHRTPNVTLSLKEDSFERLAPLLADSTIDLVLTRFTNHRLLANFRQQTVFEDPLVIVCGSRHSLASKQHVTWQDLDGMPWILPESGTPTRAFLERELAQHGLKVPSGCVESQTWTVHLEVLRAYPFLALLPLTLARKYGGRTPMRVLPLSTSPGLEAVKAVWREDSDNFLVNLVLETVKKCAQEGWGEYEHLVK